MLKMFSDTFNFAKIIISSYLEEKLRKSYSSMVTVMLDGDALSKFWIDQSPYVKTSNLPWLHVLVKLTRLLYVMLFRKQSGWAICSKILVTCSSNTWTISKLRSKLNLNQCVQGGDEGADVLVLILMPPRAIVAVDRETRDLLWCSSCCWHRYGNNQLLWGRKALERDFRVIIYDLQGRYY